MAAPSDPAADFSEVSETFALVTEKGGRGARVKPSAKAAVAASLPRGTILPVLRDGLHEGEGRGGFPMLWLEVRLPNGKLGYLHSTEVFAGKSDEIKALSTLDFQTSVAFFHTKVKLPSCVEFPGARAKGTTAEDDSRFPAGNAFVPIVGRLKRDGAVWYRVRYTAYQLGVGSMGDVECWLAEKDGEFVSDLYAYTSRIAGRPEWKDLFDAANQAIGGDFNVREAKVRELPLTRDRTTKYYEVLATRGRGALSHALYLARGRGPVKVLGTLGISYTKQVGELVKPEVRDLDGDGEMELVEFLPPPGHGGGIYRVHALKSGAYARMLEITDPFDEGRLLFHGPYVIVSLGPKLEADRARQLSEETFGGAPWSPKFKGRKLRALQFAKGGFGEIPAESLPPAAKKALEKPARDG